MRIEELTIRQIRLPLVSPFETSFGVTRDRLVLLLEARSDGLRGWGECVAGERPFYTYETVAGSWQILQDYLIPALLGQDVSDPGDVSELFRRVRGYPMARASLEAAVWDLKAQQTEQPLWKLMKGTQSEIPCGVSIGIQKSIGDLLERIASELQDGYRKIKIKIKPGWDVEVVREVRRKFPEISLMADANAAYTGSDFSRLQQLDEFDLLMLEQPLEFDDLLHHSQLQEWLKTPICLDESIRHSGDAELAIEMESCRIINIKTGRVGGHGEAIRIHDLCQKRQIPVWCGGMLETGIGRAHNIALSTLPNFRLPGDVSASKRYYENDIIDPPVEVSADGTIEAPSGVGLGFEVDTERLDHLSVAIEKRTTRKLPRPL